MSFLVIPESPKVRKKVEKIGLGSFKYIEVYIFRKEISQDINLNSQKFG